MSIERPKTADSRVGSPSSWQSPQSRRAFLARSAGAAVLLVGAGRLPFRLGRASGTLGASAAPPDLAPYYIYGLPTTDPTAPTAVEAQGSQRGVLADVPAGTGLAALPVKSPDGETLALVSVGETGAAPALFVTYLDVGTGQIRTQADLPLPDLPIDTSLLVTPAFAADSSTLCLVLSITVPTRTTPVRKMDPESGAVVIVPGATWVSHHALAYFQGRTGEFVGPFDLDDSPSLARVNVAANSSDLFVWSIEYPGPPQRGVSAPSPAVPQV